MPIEFLFAEDEGFGPKNSNTLGTGQNLFAGNVCVFMEPYANKAKSEPIKLTRLEENLTNDAALELPLREQYKIYLFERILLCCKEINPNKAKNKMLSSNRPLVDKKGKPKLQLKGRIFMQNVTDVIFIMNKKSGKAVMPPGLAPISLLMLL